MTDDGTSPKGERDALAVESEQAHQVILRLRRIVGLVAYREEVEDQALEDALRLADAWIGAWRERRNEA